MTPQKPELLPCPFCGGEASFGWESDAAAIGRTKRRVFCGFCGIRTVAYENEAIERWNTRTDLYTSVVAERDALRAVCEGMAKRLQRICDFKKEPYVPNALFDGAEKALTAYEKHKAGE